MNVPIERNELVNYGKAIAKLDVIESIVKSMEYAGDAVKAIKCVLNITEEVTTDEKT